ncbi:hypothetical protein D0869_06413 [Hortaea werneckii]|uniref:Uncharacterized protein n=1 Tax=Hortaea werneckii TaxID=91943 RepID=A0A3M6WU89_HORWE|nr:hypothetical protein D0869_06413 [Hortaea werneckii]
MTTTAALSTSVDFISSETVSTSPHATTSPVADNFTGTVANGTNEFAASIVNGSSIPDSQIDCPVQYSGLDYVDIPWLNMSVGKYHDPNASFYDGYCGIKGALLPEHAGPANQIPRHPYLSSSGQLLTVLTLLSCRHQLLALEGDSVSNAFCRWDGGKSLSTSGSLPRDSPFDLDDYWIKEARSDAPSILDLFSFWRICAGVLLASLLL